MEGREMKLYLIRHAAAIARSEEVVEEHRYLTIPGRKSFRLTAKRMARKGEMPDVIVTSPLARALQTAEILSEALAFQGVVAVSPELAPGFDQAKLGRLLASFKRIRGLAVVGHEPDLGEVAGALLKLGRPLPLKKGMVVCLKVPPAKRNGKVSLKWLLFEGKKIDASTLPIGDEEAKSKRRQK
jgi:phosphohistidine phosphatase